MLDLLDYIHRNTLVLYICTLILASSLSMYFVPALRKLATAKNFTDSPSARKSHSSQVPFLGGVAIYLSTSLPLAFFSIFFFKDIMVSDTALILGFGSLTLLVLGVIDDINGLKPITKLIFQVAISFIVLYTLQVNICNMYGIFEIFALPTSISLTLSLFVYVIFMNMLNLIDGIDGLASGLSLTAFSFFAYVYYTTGNSFNMLICLASIGSLIPFIYYNMFSDKKIFLGDNGSLILGFILGFLALDLLSSGYNIGNSLFSGHTPVVLMSLFSFPLVDTLRVFTIRTLRKRSPFSPDKNHVHHHLIRLGLSHRQATLIILVYTVFITSLSFFLLEVNINIAFVVLLTVASLCICLPAFLVKKIKSSN
jgi:UDP-GlcNAc:undecaprenyl-phosphate/decaprenyl-phosphate GlcNAc-1-phosphate transferase